MLLRGWQSKVGRQARLPNCHGAPLTLLLQRGVQAAQQRRRVQVVGQAQQALHRLWVQAADGGGAGVLGAVEAAQEGGNRLGGVAAKRLKQRLIGLQRGQRGSRR